MCCEVLCLLCRPSGPPQTLHITYVSRKAATKGRAVLEGEGLDSCSIKASFNSASEEAAVQDGLIKWKDGQGHQPPTWEVLISAMEYAKIAQQHIEDLKKELHLHEEQEPATVKGECRVAVCPCWLQYCSDGHEKARVRQCVQWSGV